MTIGKLTLRVYASNHVTRIICVKLNLRVKHIFIRMMSHRLVLTQRQKVAKGNSEMVY